MSSLSSDADKVLSCRVSCGGRSMRQIGEKQGASGVDCGCFGHRITARWNRPGCINGVMDTQAWHDEALFF
jgi:hypothetical protein